MQLRESYDWVVLGDHPGALFGAVLGARLGLSVLVLPFGSSMKVLISNEGDCLDPEPNFLLGISRLSEQTGLLADCFGRLGVLPAEEESIQAQAGIPQVLTPSNRFALSSDNISFGSELEREFGEKYVSSLGLIPALQEAEADYWKFWLDLPERLSLPTGEKKLRSLKALRQSINAKSGLPKGPGRFWLSHGKKASHAKAVRENPEMAQALLGLWYGIVSHPVYDPMAADILQIFSLARMGGRFRGGMAAYREFLLRLAKRQGAEVPAKLECKRLIVEKGRLVAVEIVSETGAKAVSIAGTSAESAEPRRISVRGGILGASLDVARERLSRKGRGWTKRLKRGPRKEGWRFTVALRVNAEAIPPGMSSRMIWKEGEAPAFEIETVLPSEYGLDDFKRRESSFAQGESAVAGQRNRNEHGASDEEQRMIFLRTMMPFTEESLDPAYQRLIAGRMVRKFMEFVPFVEFHMIRVFPDFRLPSASEEFAKVYPFRNLSEIPDNLCCFAVENSQGGVGSSSGIEGLFLASSEAYPELGSLGGVVAALEATAWLAHRSGLPGPFG